MNGRRMFDVLQLILLIFLIVFGLFILYQIILKILGGSWTTEAVIISFLVLLISIVFSIAVSQIRFTTDYNYFKKDMYGFHREFREFREEVGERL